MDQCPESIRSDSGAPEVLRAERALYERMVLACEAATAEDVPGRFRTWDDSGVLAVLATDSSLAFLATVSGVTPETMPAAIDVTGSRIWGGIAPTVMTSMNCERGADAPFLAAGLERGPVRALAVKQLSDVTVPDGSRDQGLSDTQDIDEFLRVLLAGYEVSGPVAMFIAAEHRHAAVQRFILLDQGAPIAAAAMTLHGDVAVLGGASTLPQHRRRGAQSRLIEQRVRLAAASGCALAVATTRPGSVSEANLLNAGFRIHTRTTWTRTARTL